MAFNWLRSVFRSQSNYDGDDASGASIRTISGTVTHNDPEVSSITLTAPAPTLEDSVLNDSNSTSRIDTRIGLSDTDTQLPRTLMREAYQRFNNANGDLSGQIYTFMQDFVFNSNNFDTDNTSDVIDYLRSIAKGTDDIKAKQAAETASTVFLHKDSYIERQKGRNQSISRQGFKNYLFGENGVLTQKRLNDMKRANNFVSNYKRALKEKTNHNLVVDGNSFDKLTVSYSNNSNGKALVNINDNKSLGMSTDKGNLYWNCFNEMFREKVDTRKTIRTYSQKSILKDYQRGNTKLIGGRDWKKRTIKNYASYLRNQENHTL